MKSLKKMMALALAMVMVLAMGMTVFADTPAENPETPAAATYSITVTNTNTSASIVGKEYSAYKLFDVTYSGTNYAYSIATNNYFYTNAKSVLDTYFDFTDIASDSTRKTVTVKESKQDAKTKTLSAADVRALADALEPYMENATAANSATATGESVTIDLTEAGYYIVTGSIKPKDEDRSDEEIVSAVILDNAAPTATVNPKASVPELNKEIKKVKEGTTEVSGALLDDDGKAAVAKVGSTVEYEITATTPDLTGYTDYIYKATDTITAGLEYVQDSFELKIDGAVVDIDPVFSNSDKTFTLTIPYNTMKNYAAGKSVVITYSCTVTADSLNYDYAKNTAKLEYSHNPFDEDDTDTTPESETYVLNINLDVNKVAENASGEKLTGAKFKLRKSDTEYYKWDETNGKVTWVAKDAADEFETSNGKLTQQVRGLDKGTYYLVETAAPTGYNLLKDPITVEISVTEGNDKKVTYTATAGGQNAAVTNGVVDLTAAQNANQPVATATIINQSGAELPSTGGIGTTIFYVIGAILVLGAGILLVTRRRMNAN